jgi:hypothetical protein
MTHFRANLSLVVEDVISRAVALKVIHESTREFRVTQVLGLRGKPDIQKKILEYNRSASQLPFVVIVDMDNDGCPPGMLARWFPSGVARKMMFRVAVREVESWILADRVAFAEYIGIRQDSISPDPDLLSDPKKEIFDLVRRSRKRNLKLDVLPRDSASQGPAYNLRIGEFVHSKWRPAVARESSRSLERFIRALERFLEPSTTEHHS